MISFLIDPAAPPFLNGSVVTFWSIYALAVLLMAIAKSGFGGAIASLSAPLMLTILPARETLAILLPLYMLTDIWANYDLARLFYWRILFWMVLFAVIGQILGYLLISMINDDMLKAMIGAIAIIVGCRYFIRLNSQTRIDEKRKMRKKHPCPGINLVQSVRIFILYIINRRHSGTDILTALTHASLSGCGD